MNISAKTEYACIAVLELAARYGSGDPVRIGAIAKRQGIPSRFLVQILLQLKGAGLVISTRGAAGGYRLAKDPADLVLAEVMAVIEGPLKTPEINAGVETPITRALMETWAEIARGQQEALGSITFADLLERAEGRAANMYYI